MTVRSPAVAPSLWQRLRDALFAPVDNASLVFFRIAFGLLMLWEVSRYFRYGWIHPQWIEPQFLFKYYGFSWVRPWLGNGMYIHWWALGGLAAFITIGFLYRLSTALFFLGFTYCFLLDQATYLNHFYLICLLSFLLIFLPANRALSADAWFRPRLRAQTAPAWALWILRAQIAIVYFFGGLAKFSPDWLRGEPMRAHMAKNTSFPVIGQFFREEWAVYAVSYGGLFLDLLIAPLLLWRRTRIPALCAGIIFHLINSQLFRIGIFPWLGIAATLLFLPPSWPRWLIHLVRRKTPLASESASARALPRHATVVLSLLGVYVLLQLLVPLRHFLYPGRVDWTSEGHRFSWRMKLVDRQARARFYVIDENVGREAQVNPRTYLRSVQANKMAATPDMILQFAHFLAGKLPQRGVKPLRVEARVMASLNGRKPELFVNQSVNLAAEPRTLRPAPWILPMKEPLPMIRPVDAKPAPAEESEPGAE
ncbi:MAG: HTTM domain-containing protein [Chthoniobacterales bacterium]|nr:HTTM domain-containing protein [Chthoniobacterales bacterium]